MGAGNRSLLASPHEIYEPARERLNIIELYAIWVGNSSNDVEMWNVLVLCFHLFDCARYRG